MSSLREKYLGMTSNAKTSLRQKYGLEKNSKYYKNIYEEEKAEQNKIKTEINKKIYDQGVMVNTNNFGIQRVSLPVQEQHETARTGFKPNQNSLRTNIDKEQKYKNIKESNEYRQKENELIEQSNKVGYAKYDYDKAVVDEDKIDILDKTIGTVVGGAKSVFDISGGLIKNENGDYQYLSNKTQLKSQKTLDSYDTKVGKFLGTVGHEVGKIGATSLINTALPGVGSTLYFGRLFMDSTNNAVSEGYDTDSATLYGAVSVAKEALIGKALGSATKGLTGGTVSGYEQLLNKTFTKLLNKPKIANILANMGSEATEEFVQEYLDNITKLAILDKSSNLSEYLSIFTDEEIFADAIYSAGVGAITGGTLGTITGQNTNVNNSDIYSTLREELEQTKQKTSNKDTVKKIDTLIENINNKKADASVGNTNTSVTPTLETSASYANNIPRSNNNVKSSILPITNSTQVKEKNTSNFNNLSNEQQAKITELDNEFKRLKTIAEAKFSNDKTTRNKRIKSYAMEIAAKKREIIQGDWLIPIEGGLTPIELSKKIEKLKSNYVGKQVTVNGENAKIIGNSYGKIGVEFADGTRKYVEKSEITPVNDIDATISEQKKIMIQKNYQSTLNQNITEQQKKQTKGNIPINQELLNKNIKKYTEKEISNIKSERIQIAKSDNDIKNFVEEAINTKSSNKTIYFGKVNDELAKQIYEKIGINVKDYNLSLKAGNIKKILKDHGNPKTEALRGQIAISKDDFKYIDDIILENDNFFSSGTTEQGKTSITFEKNLDGKYMLVEYISDKHHNLEVQTMWKNKKKNSVTVLHDSNPGLNTSKTGSDTSSLYANNIPQSNENVKSGTLPITNNTQNSENNTINMPPVGNKIVNPNEISKLTLEDANTTPILPTINVSTGRGESKFVKNIENKVNMLTEESKNIILSDNDVKYYQEVTNKVSLDKAFERLNEGGKSEVLNWFNKESKNATEVDVAEGWILLKQYQDSVEKETDLIKKDELNRTMVQVAKKMREIGTKAGQTVQAFNILNRLTPEGMVYYAQSELFEAFEVMSKNKTKEWIDNNRDKFDLTPQETQFIMDTMQGIQQMEDGYDKRVKLAEIQKIMTDKLPPSKGAGIKAWMRISMLFNPKTQVRNVGGNAIIAPVNVFSDLFASAVDRQIAKRTGVRTTGTFKAKSYAKGLKKGFYESYNDFKKGINTRNIQGNRFEITEGKSFNENTLIGKKLNQVDALLSFMLDAGDRTFYEATFTNSINNQLILNNTDVVTQEMVDIATSEALSRTWQDNNNYTRFVLNIRKGLNAINVKGYGLGDILIPFAKTPANLTKAIVDYSPLGLINTVNKGMNLKKSLTNGQYNAQMQHQFVQSLGKATVGTMLYVLGYALAQAGTSTGESDDDKDVANFMKNTLGVNSYSIKIGNKSFTYDWAQPVAAPFAMMANLVQKQKDGVALRENIISTLDTGLNVLFEQSFMESLSNVLSEPGEIGTKLMEEVLSLPSRAVPTLMKQIADLIDPVQRTSFEYDKPLETSFNKVKAKIPFISKTLAPSVDTMGREIKKYGGKNNIFNVFLNPANVSTENISKSAEEIYRLYKSTGKTNIMPRVAPYYVDKDNKKIILTSNQREKYQKISGEIIEKNIEKLLKTSEYKNMSDKDKAEVINSIVNYSYNIAQKEILDIELSTTYEKAYEYSKIGNMSDYYTFKTSIDDTNKDTKRTSISNYLINSNLGNKQLAFLYGSYYSSEETLNSLLNANVPIKEFIKFNSQEFTTDYYESGKAVPNSRKFKVIKYINSLNLSIPQKAILIKMEYSSFDNYDSQIVKYINNMNYSEYEKASLLKSFGFDYYDKYLINYVNGMNISKEEKIEMLEDMGFTIRNGRVYVK